MDVNKVARAAGALKNYLIEHREDNGKAQLFEDDGDFVYLSVKSKHYFADHKIMKPELVELPTGLWAHRSESPRVCVFTRDPQRQFKDLLLDGKTPISRVIGVSKLKGKFKPFEARRALRSDFDVFLGEDYVVRMLPKLLGSVFFGKQASIPVPIRLQLESGEVEAADVAKKVESILQSTTIVYNASQIMRVRIGTTKHTDAELAANAKAVVDALASKNLIEISIRTNTSPTLPVWFAEKIYDESDIGDSNDEDFETEGQKRAREDAHLDELLAEVADEEDIREYNLELKKRRKQPKPANKLEETKEE